MICQLVLKIILNLTLPCSYHRNYTQCIYVSNFFRVIQTLWAYQHVIWSKQIKSCNAPYYHYNDQLYNYSQKTTYEICTLRSSHSRAGAVSHNILLHAITQTLLVVHTQLYVVVEYNHYILKLMYHLKLVHFTQ